MAILQISLIAFALWLISGTLLNFSKHPHWYIRGWDFPRVFVALISASLGAVYITFFHARPWDYALLAGLLFVAARQIYLIYPYTPLAPKLVKRSTAAADGQKAPPRLRLVISNVLQENEQHDLWLKVITGTDPDVIVAVEIDDKWDRAVAKLAERYPHHIRQPQDNYYGMVVYSKLPFDKTPGVQFLVQDDIPSIHITLQLAGGHRVCLHAMHPRPPEPLRNQDSSPRDAELIVLAKEIGKHQRDIGTIVCGDLNDVAWSYTTQLFLRLSRLLDPRKGRGPYNSFNANSRIFRFPLDHVFHSDEFKLIDLRVLPFVGSDHFPMLIELSCEPEAARGDQTETTPKAEDQEEAAEIIEEQIDREKTGEEKGHLSTGRTHAQ